MLRKPYVTLAGCSQYTVPSRGSCTMYMEQPRHGGTVQKGKTLDRLNNTRHHHTTFECTIQFTLKGAFLRITSCAATHRAESSLGKSRSGIAYTSICESEKIRGSKVRQITPYPLPGGPHRHRQPYPTRRLGYTNTYKHHDHFSIMTSLSAVYLNTGDVKT